MSAAQPANVSAAAPVLSLRGVHTHIGPYHILHGVDLAVPAGSVTMLLGRNGVGKTTTLRTIMGLWRASAGEVSLLGQPIAAMSTPDIARLGVAYVPENMGIFADLSVRENLWLAAREAARPQAMREEVLARIFGFFPALKTFWQHPAGKLSGGQKQMLAIARAMIEPRALLLVDEPSKGLAPAIVDNMVEAFAALKREGATILLVEQNVSVAQRLGDHVVVMDDGRCVHSGEMAAFAADPDLQAKFLGLSQ